MTGLFETIRIREGTVPFLERHLARLAASCTALGRSQPEPGLAGRIEAHASAGESIVRVTLDERGERIEPRPVPPAGPMRIVFSGTRHEPYPHKLTVRKLFDRARSLVVPYRADEAVLLTEDGILAEGCVTSVFFWIGDVLCTPSLDIGILPGVGRARVLEVAREKGLEVKEGRFGRPDFQGLPMFLANSVRGVLETATHGDWRRQGDDRTSLLARHFWG